MKLRLRCIESKETLRIQVPSPCTLSELQQILAQSLSPPPPSRSALRFSLNAREDLPQSSPDASLESLGITSGDLIYFSTNRSAFSPNPNIGERDALDLVSESHRIPGSIAGGETSISGMKSGNSEGASDLAISSPKLPQVQDRETLISQGIDTHGQNSSNQPSVVESQEAVENESGVLEEAEAMDIDGDSAVNKFSEPYFLRRVLREELGDDRVDHKLMVIAVHAVLLESGFISFDSVSRMPVDRFHLPDEWPSAASTVSLRYTLPELLTKSNPESDFSNYVVMKVQLLGNFINVYGCLSMAGSLYRICLDEHRFAPILDSVWANCEENVRMDEDVSSKSYAEKEVFEFWKMLKDGLALPLLIDLCEKSGLALPACLMRLPTELKLKILESLPGTDLAKVECVCSEMRYLASNNDLWKQKYKDEFGDGSSAQDIVNWREKFFSSWERRKQQKLAITLWPGNPGVERTRLPIIWRDPVPFPGPLPGIVGGDYDLHPAPAPGIPSLFPRARPRFRQNFRPICNLGGMHDA